MHLNRILYVLQVHADAFGLHHQLLHFLLLHFLLQQPFSVAGARVRRRGHDGADARLGLQPAFPGQVLNDLVCGIRMHFQVRGQRSHRGKGLSRRA